jgi:pyruvate formate lyase activating enzyme
VLKHTDYLLFDVKHSDAAAHRQYTGLSNKLILQNLRLAATDRVHLLVRVPLVSGVTDTRDNIETTTELIKALGDKMDGIELMPYHRLGLSKYEALGIAYPMGDLPPADMNHVEQIGKMLENLGVHCRISK